MTQKANFSQLSNIFELTGQLRNIVGLTEKSCCWVEYGQHGNILIVFKLDVLLLTDEAGDDHQSQALCSV